jgi:branched-chain amino acid transport system ATP-binding protein
MTSSDAVIATKNLSAGYNGIPVVEGITLQVKPGEVVALLGANGAGKTTTLMALSGDVKALAGEVLWKGKVTTAPTHVRCRNGLAFLSEERAIFAKLSTEDNLRLGRGGVKRALDITPELGKLLKRKAGLLSGGEQQMLALTRAIAAQPAVLLADELSLGLAPMMTQRLLTAVRNAADLGIAVIVVEQHVRNALSVADRIYVLRRGKVVMEGTATEMRGRMSEIEAHYLAGPAEVPSAPAGATTSAS